MKKSIFVIFVALVITCIFTSCESKSGKRVKEMSTTKTVQLSQQEYDSLRDQAQQLQYLKEGQENFKKLLSALKKNPHFFLLLLDAELSATEKKEETYGSFSDFFIPTIHEALDAGVPRVEIQKRINKLIELANRGLFVSSYEESLFKEGGTKAIIESIGLD